MTNNRIKVTAAAKCEEGLRYTELVLFCTWCSCHSSRLEIWCLQLPLSLCQVLLNCRNTHCKVNVNNYTRTSPKRRGLGVEFRSRPLAGPLQNGLLRPCSVSTTTTCSSPSATTCISVSSLNLLLIASTGYIHASASLVTEQGNGNTAGAATGSPMEESCNSTSSKSNCASVLQKTIKDKLGHEHYLTPHCGPAVISLRASKFHSSNIQVHINLQPIDEAGVQEGKTMVTLIVDGGPDWSTTCNSLVNALFYMQLWRDNNLDVLVDTSYAARFSAFSPIEHLWSRLSKKLNGVTLSAVAPGDSKPPCKTSWISNSERSRKEGEVFD